MIRIKCLISSEYILEVSYRRQATSKLLLNLVFHLHLVSQECLCQQQVPLDVEEVLI